MKHIKESLSRKDVQSVIARVYPQIVKNLGRSKRGTPKVEIHNNIYVRVSGVEGSEGEEDPDAEYEWDKNEIYLYLPKMKNEEEVIKSLLHEYTHATQDPKKREENRKLGYAKNPHEIEATKAEKNWKKYKNMKHIKEYNTFITEATSKTIMTTNLLLMKRS